jgi:hypothetical protein
VTNIYKRFSTEEVLNHPWLATEEWTQEKQMKSLKENTEEELNLKKEAIVQYFEKAGFARDFVLQSMNKNLFNHIKACYESLSKLLIN